MWSKGAVVILKHGDTEWSNSMENALTQNLVPKKEINDLESRYGVMKNRQQITMANEIQKAQKTYAIRKPLIRWPKILIDIWALSVYGFSMLVERVTNGGR